MLREAFFHLASSLVTPSASGLLASDLLGRRTGVMTRPVLTLREGHLPDHELARSHLLANLLELLQPPYRLSLLGITPRHDRHSSPTARAGNSGICGAPR